MKSFLLDIIKNESDVNLKINIMREYLQLYALRCIQDKGYFSKIAFVGGTALRFLFNLPRFSEDLDFSLIDVDGYDFNKLLKHLKSHFEFAGYNVQLSFNEKKNVHNTFLKFSDILFEAGLSSRKEHNISIKLEIDTNPPDGANIKNSILNKYFPINFNHYDLQSLFAGKLHAILTRQYTKGRDYFDLFWYLSKYKNLLPNYLLLNNALKQTNSIYDNINSFNFKKIICSKIESQNWETIKKDISPFIEDNSYLNFMNSVSFIRLLENYLIT